MRIFVLTIISSFIILPNSIGANDRNLVDLSDITYGVNQQVDTFIITFTTTKMKAKIKSCTNFNITSDTTAICEEGRFVRIETEFTKDSTKIFIPFNISCGTNENDRNVEIITNINHVAFPDNISLSWDPPNNNIRNYLWYCFDGTGRYTTDIKGRAPSLDLMGLKEKSWYQICIATINDRSLTGKFICQSVLTDFKMTGPIINEAVTSESDRILISWSLPEYKYDIPQGYIVHIRGPSNQCKIVTIKLENVAINVDDSCPDRQTLQWAAVKSLEISGLDVFSKYDITIAPFNRKKPSNKTYLSIVTKEGESDAVRNLRIGLNDPNWFHIEFLEPSRPQGKIIRYDIKIRSMKRNICIRENELVYNTSVQLLYNYISKDVLKKCGSYLVEVFPVNGWNQNGGIGKRASITFDHRINSYSSPTIVAKSISSKILKLTVKDIHNDVKCEILGFVIEIRNEEDRSNCFLKRITNTNCDEIANSIKNISECSNITSSTFDKQSTNLELIFGGFFRDGARYRIKVWRITDIFEEVSFQTILAEDTKDCFTDCYIPRKAYFGIQSATKTGIICLMWKDTKYKYYKSVKSNICTMEGGATPWCATPDSSWDRCDVPQCSTLDYGTGCVSVNNVYSSTDTITIKWSPPDYSGKIIGYVILLHNSNNECLHYYMELSDSYTVESDLEYKVKAFYLSCKSRQKGVIPNSHNQVSFTNLHQNRKYIAYIIPIINKSRIGEVKNITIETLLARPDVPSSIRKKSATLHEIEINWDKPKESKQYGIADKYSVSMRKVISNEISQKEVSNEQTKESNLEACTEYCFTVSSTNTAGSSEYSKDFCTFTLAPRPAKVELKDLSSGYSSSQYIEWEYLGSDTCPKVYLVDYRIKYLTQSIQIRTNDSSTKLIHLTKNVFYSVEVRAEGLMRTIDDANNGEFSETKEFYTGTDKPSIKNYTEDLQKLNKILNISWIVNDDTKGALFEYIVQLKNASGKCIFLIHFICGDCPVPLNHKYISKNQREKRQKSLLCAQSNNRTFSMNDMFFSHAFSFKEKLSNFSVEIFGINMKGIHSLSKTEITISAETNMSIMVVILIIAICLILSLIILLVLIRQRKKPQHLYNLIFNRKESGDENHIILTRSKKSENEDNNVSPRESNGDLPSKLPSKKFTEFEENPTIKAKQPSTLSISNKKINTTISVTGFSAYYEKVSLNGSVKIIQEYKKLSSEAKVLESSLGLTVDAGKDSAVAKKNRFVNILPFDQNRVKVGEKGFPRDYINASYIPFVAGEDKVEYIASQGPIDESISQFWQMIWEQNINCIIMLTRTMEGDKFKCLQYWPNKVNESLLYGNKNHFNVTLLEEDEKESHIERKIEVENTKINEKRLLVQIHMHTWSDHSAPNLDHFDKMLFRFHEISNENVNYPYLVHCSAGVGRTGTLICIDRIIKELINGATEIDIYDRVLKLRKYRNFMVQRQAQYVFIHDYINHFLSKYMKISEGEDPLYFNEG